jgi:hypothetical protein
MTINKSQGQTFIHVAICLVQIVHNGNAHEDGSVSVAVAAAEVFGHGQFYVGASRSGNPTKVCVYTTADQLDKDTIINVVYPEALPMEIRGQPDGVVYRTARVAEPVNGSNSIIDMVPDELDPPRDYLSYVYRDGIRVPANHEFEDVPHHGYQFDMEPNGSHSAGELHHYVEYYNQLAAEHGRLEEEREEWIQDVLNADDYMWEH